MNKKRYTIACCMLGALLLACSTSNDVDEMIQAPDGMEDGTPILVPATFSVETDADGLDPFAGAEGRGVAPTSGINETAAANAWVFQFDGQADNSVLVALPQYFKSTTGQSIALLASSSPNRIVAIVNHFNAGYDWKMVPLKTTYGDLRAMSKGLNAESDLYYNNYLMMSGICDVPQVNTSTALNFTVRRNVAKLEFTIKNSAPNVTVTSLQLKNVSPALDFLASQVTVPAGTPYPAVTSPMMDFGSYNTTTELVSGAQKTYVFYVPRNEKGTVTNTDAQLKYTYAPKTAMYLELLATNSGTGVQSIYRFHPGANMINDFNIKPNNRYIVNITLNSSGDPTVDSRVETSTPGTQIIDMKNKVANCYILNPPKQGTRKYRIYPKQVNLFWGNHGYAYAIPSMIGTDPMDLANSRRWAIKVVWEDADLFSTGAGDWMQISVDAQARSDEQYFEITIPSTLVKRGNFVVGLFNNDDGNGTKDINEPYLWSWHFWVTDYDPNMVVTPTPGTYVYNVRNGAVHRYAGAMWEGGIYKKGVIMDRDLGTMGELNRYNQDPPYPSAVKGLLYYQFGRKDPLPQTNYDNSVYLRSYDLKTNTSAYQYYDGYNGLMFPAGFSDDGRIESSMAVPGSKLSHFNNGNSDWCKPGDEIEGAMFLWKDPLIKGSVDALVNRTEKSLFDPCPYGWQVPNKGTFDDMNMTNTGDASRGLMEFFGENPNYPNKLPRYWPGTTGDPVNGKIYFPPGGGGSNMQPSCYSNGNRWMSTPFNMGNGYFFQTPVVKIQKSYFNTVTQKYEIVELEAGTSWTTRAFLNQVRCVKLDATVIN